MYLLKGGSESEGSTEFNTAESPSQSTDFFNVETGPLTKKEIAINALKDYLDGLESSRNNNIRTIQERTQSANEKTKQIHKVTCALEALSDKSIEDNTDKTNSELDKSVVQLSKTQQLLNKLKDACITSLKKIINLFKNPKFLKLLAAALDQYISCGSITAIIVGIYYGINSLFSILTGLEFSLSLGGMKLHHIITVIGSFIIISAAFINLNRIRNDENYYLHYFEDGLTCIYNYISQSELGKLIFKYLTKEMNAAYIYCERTLYNTLGFFGIPIIYEDTSLPYGYPYTPGPSWQNTSPLKLPASQKDLCNLVVPPNLRPHLYWQQMWGVNAVIENYVYYLNEAIRLKNWIIGMAKMIEDNTGVLNKIQSIVEYIADLMKNMAPKEAAQKVYNDVFKPAGEQIAYAWTGLQGMLRLGNEIMEEDKATGNNGIGFVPTNTSGLTLGLEEQSGGGNKKKSVKNEKLKKAVEEYENIFYSLKQVALLYTKYKDMKLKSVSNDFKIKIEDFFEHFFTLYDQIILLLVVPKYEVSMKKIIDTIYLAELHTDKKFIDLMNSKTSTSTLKKLTNNIKYNKKISKEIEADYNKFISDIEQKADKTAKSHKLAMLSKSTKSASKSTRSKIRSTARRSAISARRSAETRPNLARSRVRRSAKTRPNLARSRVRRSAKSARSTVRRSAKSARSTVRRSAKSARSTVRRSAISARNTAKSAMSIKYSKNL